MRWYGSPPWSTSHHLPRVGDRAGDGARRRGERARQEGAPAGPLPPLEVAVAGADGVLPRAELVAVHGDAHRAAGLAPLPARLAEYAVEPLRLRLSLHLLRAGHDEQPYVGGDLPAAQQRRRQTQVAEAGVGARADEHHVDRMPQEP